MCVVGLGLAQHRERRVGRLRGAREGVGSGTCSRYRAAVRVRSPADWLTGSLSSQVLGRKYIRLYSPQESEALYPHDTHLLHNTSQVGPSVALQLLPHPTPFLESRQMASLAFFRLTWRILTWRSSPGLLRPHSCPASCLLEKSCSSRLNIGIMCEPWT